MKKDRARIRDKYEDNLVSDARFGDWSLDKYTNNEGFVVYHWVCGYWTHTFYNDKPNFCAHCLEQSPYPEEIEHLYRLANFDLMTTALYNSSLHND